MTTKGSSPRVRGKACAGRWTGPRSGIIPAGAGKSKLALWKVVWTRDHPRGCGEKQTNWSHITKRQGSSPRVRGKAGGALGEPECRGIIPAGAGKSRPQRGAGRLHRDHPRGCGEKSVLVSILFLLGGSSPRVRGKAQKARPPEAAWGIIPAGAGKRQMPAVRQALHGDHPRGCGEKCSGVDSEIGDAGSSPRVRGKERAAKRRPPKTGIIPAGAGKSAKGLQSGDALADHPRGCGEKKRTQKRSTECVGSSPRVRGKG